MTENLPATMETFNPAKQVAADLTTVAANPAKKGVFSQAASWFGKTRVGSALGKAGKWLTKKAPIIGAVIQTCNEIPKIGKAFKNGDGWQQIGRSLFNIGGAALSGLVVGASAPTVVGFGAGIAASMGIDYAAGKAGNAIFGKSKEDQKNEQMAQVGQQNQEGQPPYQQDPSLMQNNVNNPLINNLSFGTGRTSNPFGDTGTSIPSITDPSVINSQLTIPNDNLSFDSVTSPNNLATPFQGQSVFNNETNLLSSTAQGKSPLQKTYPSYMGNTSPLAV